MNWARKAPSGTSQHSAASPRWPACADTYHYLHQCRELHRRVVRVWYRRQVNFGMFVRLIRMIGLRDTGIILVQAPWGCPMSSLNRCTICPQGLVVGGTSSGRERESVPSLWMWLWATSARSVNVLCCWSCFSLFHLFLPLSTVPACPFIVQGGLVFKG
jgi:hypothetical protein